MKFFPSMKHKNKKKTIDVVAYAFAEVKCPVCKRKFVKAPQHALHDAKGRLVCSPSCSSKSWRDSQKKQKDTSKSDARKHFKPITVNGMEYQHSGYFARTQRVNTADFIKARANGLPCVKRDKYYYYRKQDVTDYYLGKIGKDVEVQK